MSGGSPEVDPVGRAFDAWLRAVRSGHRPSIEELVGDDPELRAELAAAIEEHELLRGAAPDVEAGAGVIELEAGEGRVEPGLVLGDYCLLRQLGRGGMGSVWEAEQISLPRRVALKLLHPQFSLSVGTLQRFQREAEASVRSSHPGIVTVLAVGHVGGRHFIAEELVPEGRTWSDRLSEVREEPPPPPARYREVAEVLRAVASALHAAHEAGVIHRDVKPSNILLDPDGRPRISDFGLARIEDEVGLSLSGQIVGTPYYMSPEQAQPRPGGLDRRTDVYSLGATLYESLTLRRPFDGDTSQQILLKILSEDPTDPRRLRSRVPTELALICLKAMEKNPDRRYATAAELAEDLDRWLSDRPVLARPPSLSRRVGKWAHRHPAVTAAFVLGTLALSTISVLLVDTARARARADADRRQLESLVSVVLSNLQAYSPKETDLVDPVLRNVLDETADNLEREFTADTLLTARLSHELGEIYEAWGDFERAERFLRRALAVREAELGRRQADTASTLHALGIVRGKQHARDEALPIFEEALAIRIETLGEESEAVQQTRNALSLCHLLAGRLDEAEAYMLAAIEDLRRRPDADANETLMTVEGNYGVLLQNQGRLREAVTLLEETLERRRRNLGESHPSTEQAYSALAHVYVLLDRVDLAVQYREKATEAVLARYGPSHPATLQARAGLASALFEAEEVERAMELQRDLLAAHQEQHGPTALPTLNVRMNLSFMLHERGHREEALGILEETVGALRAQLPAGHRDLLGAQYNLAVVQLEMGALGAARETLEPVLAAHRGRLPDDHLDVLRAECHEAEILRREGRLAEAAALAESVHRRAAAALGPEHSTTLYASHQLGLVRRSEGRLDEAEEIFRHAAETAAAALGPESAQAERYRAERARTLLAAGRVDEALELCRDVRASGRAARGDDHPRTLATTVLLAEAERAADRPETALALYRDVVARGEGRLGDASPTLLEARAGLADLGEWREAAHDPTRPGQPSR